MKKIGIFYGSDTGNTEHVAKLIAKKLNIDSSDIFDTSKTDAKMLNNFEVLIFGSSTQGYGDLQSDWEDFIDNVKKTDLIEKKVAVFGLGDASSYSDTFCDAIGIIAKAAQQSGATLIGNSVNPSEYEFDDSAALDNGLFCGLPLDEDNQSDQSEDRINLWLSQLQPELE